ncbi:hypothetical protein GE09DRAFT_181782 [Coniochaeta sp. 2T2.1]|nr:hypothetical protein GE09DRAFT_181782 [Coniochaeta sp. 2T2.1]
MGATQGHGSLGGPATNKITKTKGKVVKPILKKLSYSEKGSLDLDRGWEDQQVVHSIGGGDAALWEPYGRGRTAKDVSFSFGAGARGSSGGRNALSGKEGPAGIIIPSSSGSHGGANVVRKTYQSHGRSHSGASIATTGSGNGSGSGGVGSRSGSFVHPFQQMPRTSTPPLSYANSLASFDNSSVHGGGAGGAGGAARDYSPTITETEDDDGDGNGSTSTSLRPQLHLNSTLNSTNSNTGLHTHLIHHHSHHPSLQSTHSSTFSHSGLRRPSLASQRTSSLTDITSALTTSTTSPQLRVSTNNTTGRSTPTKTSRLAPSKSDLHLNLTLSDLESPVGSTLGATPVPVASTATAPPAAPTPTSSVTTPMSPLRTSLEAMGRLRSRSEVDTATRQEQIRQARRKFEERERAKEAKYEREEVERRNRQANKEASRIEKETREWYKATGVSSGGGGGGAGSLNGSSVNVNMLGLHGLGVGSESGHLPKIPVAAVTKGGSYSSGRPSVSRKTSPTGVAASASVPMPGLLGKKRKGSFGITAGTPGGSTSRPDCTTAGGYASNGSSSRKNSGGFTTTTTLGRDRQANLEDVAKGPSAFAASNYDSLPEDASRMPRFGASIDDDGQRAHSKHRPRRSSNLKKETQTFWQGFVLWLRTRVFKLKRKAQR